MNGHYNLLCCFRSQKFVENYTLGGGGSRPGSLLKHSTVDGKDRHHYGHEMTPGGLPASLPGRLAESMVWSEDRIWPGPDS